MIDKIMYTVLGAIDDFFLKIENLFTKKKGKKEMNFKWDLKKQLEEKRKADSAKIQLRERSKQSTARPKAEKNITSKDPRLQGI